jgi:hypothetical protein
MRHTSIIPVTKESEAGESQIQVQSGQLSETCLKVR